MTEENKQQRIREIPYNYTSFSDKEIVTRLLGSEAWNIIVDLQQERRTGRSSRMLFEVLGDIWVVNRNPYLQDDLLKDARRRKLLIGALQHRLREIDRRRDLTHPTRDEKVLKLLGIAHRAVQKFESDFVQTAALRKKVYSQLKRITAPRNIHFDAFMRASHVTDATDWRIEYPFVVLTPENEGEIPALIRELISLGLVIIPRGGGTGYTGGAVPMSAMSAVINTEKLSKIGSVQNSTIPGVDQQVATLFTEAGSITRAVANVASGSGLVFSVDPASADSSTIGGNISENSGGKKAVLWGTAVDNLISYRMVTPDGNWLEVKRINHNLGKIHKQEEVTWELTLKDGYERDPSKAHVISRETLKMPGAIFRKPGIGKDVSNKFLGGLPGVQKEGCDGLITSATWLLHKMPKGGRTVCLEFFGAASLAGPAIVEITSLLDTHPKGCLLAGLEHLDDRYLHAVNYPVKTPRNDYPKMVLVGDIAGDDEQALDEICEKIVDICRAKNGEGYIAKTKEERFQFWHERSKTAAISAHTNAFKLNEDVVIPLDRIGDYTIACERFNIECSIQNKLDILNAVEQYISGEISLDKTLLQQESGMAQVLQGRISKALESIEAVRSRWDYVLNHLDEPIDQAIQELSHLGLVLPNQTLENYAGKTLFEPVYDRVVRISWKKEIRQELFHLFASESFEPIRQEIDRIHNRVLKGRVFIALHMHAGDGNVHTNVPLNSDNYAMMQLGLKAVDLVMNLAKKLGGSITGEHGIGLTKIEFIDEAELKPFHDYLDRIDPRRHFNAGKLRKDIGLENAYTPSFNLLGAESLIMQMSELKTISDSIKNCLRCGKCKSKCTTHVPLANLQYSPRNKVIATSLLIEAFLYEEQTRRGLSKQHLEALTDLSDHCTLCMKCRPPCPVKINFGDVTILMRQLLHRKGVEHFNPAKQAGLSFLTIENPKAASAARKVLIEGGFNAQRTASKMMRSLAKNSLEQPPVTTGHPSLTEHVITLVNSKLPQPKAHATLRAMLKIENPGYIPIIRKADATDAEAVLYFPGCGNEKLFSEIGLATLAMLFNAGVQTVLPPKYMCCGYPQKGSGLIDLSGKLSVENRILFHRMANTLNYLDIKTVVVSCGTCMKQLKEYHFEEIFPGCRLIDIHEYLKEKGISVQGDSNTRYIYHDPCHSPFASSNAVNSVNELIRPLDGSRIEKTDRCCGESGTFAVGRPDIATQVRFKKQESLLQAKQFVSKDGFSGSVKVLTACPGCLQGLSRYTEATGITPEFLIVEMARRTLGDGWEKVFLAMAQSNGIEQVLL